MQTAVVYFFRVQSFCADQWLEALTSDLAETMGGEIEQEIVHPRVFVAGFLAHGSRLP